MFKQARLKLTAWYLLIIMVISFSFSALIYQISSLEIIHFADSQRNRMERQFYSSENPPSPPPKVLVDDLISESQKNLLNNLIIINSVILIISGSLAYFLAGRTLSPIQKMHEDQKRFISDASHELKTPITALKTMLEVSLRDPNLDLTESKKVLTDSISATNQLKTLTDSLLELNHLNNNGSSFKLEPISIKNLMTESVKKIKPQAEVKKITIKFNPTKGKINVDGQKIEELFLILLDNAIKYSPDSSQIIFNSFKTKKNVVFKIIDKGIGISDKDLPHIFDRFYRADNARTKNSASGYGLGLSIAQKIVEQHHGSIGVQSIIKQGTTFKIILPL
ncbi:MAG: HAMP domain-containing sensor histidine kinase [Candidatus Shapirobacteria bacterium]|nr:HAMP domain-containing sensor histidine kinase [Candidatus Shapirobacteria bacterium]MDD4410143.1 HAMP domain-containing sensor histidine kinase [Candidatus Shapirobacteria bacterium]